MKRCACAVMSVVSGVLGMMLAGCGSGSSAGPNLPIPVIRTTAEQVPGAINTGAPATTTVQGIGWVRHNRSLVQVRDHWVTFDVPSGWVQVFIPSHGRSASAIEIVHPATHTRTTIGYLPSVPVPRGATPAFLVSAVCSALERRLGGLYLAPGYTQEAPTALKVSGNAVGSQCMISGTIVKTPAVLRGKHVQMPIAIIRTPDGHGMAQHSIFPVGVVTPSERTTVSGAFRQAVSNWLGRAAW